MDALSAVSETALITLKAHVLETQTDNAVFHDPMAVTCLAQLEPMLPQDVQTRILARKLPSRLTRYIALRARKHDAYAKAFTQMHPQGLVVSLGAGFDTRFWRVSSKPGKYLEVDLPPVVALKQQALGKHMDFEMIGCSVLAEAWIERIRAIQSEHVLFLAEGLFMYLSKPDVMRIFNCLAQSFSQSEIVFETANERYTRGLWKKMVASKLRRALGTRTGVSFAFGIRAAQEIESYGPNISVVEEWSYFEDRDISPRFLKLFRGLKFIARTQWTIRASLG